MEQNDFEKIIKFLFKRKTDSVFLASGFLMGIILGWDLVEILVFEIILLAILRPIESRVLAGVAFIFLVTVPFLLLAGLEKNAEQYAVYAYYFLVITVIRGIIETKIKDNSLDVPQAKI